MKYNTVIIGRHERIREELIRNGNYYQQEQQTPTSTTTHVVKDYTDKLSSKETSFTTASETLLIQIKSKIDIETDGDTLEMTHFKLNQIYRSLENFTGELYLTVLTAKGRLSYLKKEGSK